MDESDNKELHAAYLCIKSSVAEDLSSAEEIKLALQYAGYSPNDAFIKKIWKDTSPNGITFEEFLTISSNLKIPTVEDIRKLMKNVFGSSDCKVSQSQFKEILGTTESLGDLSSADLNYIFQEADVIQNDAIDCEKLSRVIFQTIKEFKQLSIEKLEEKSNHQKINSKTFTKRHHRAGSSNGSKAWYTSILKGCFYADHPSVIAHQYCLTVSHDGVTVIKIEALTSQEWYQLKPIDALGYIFSEGQDGSRSFIGVTDQIDSEGVQYWQGNLTAGKYLIIPFTTGIHFPVQPTSADNLHLFDRDEKTNKVKLSRGFKTLLLKVFDQLDLDSSGGLSRQEFNLYNWRTSGEEVQDDEWAVVQSNFSVHNNELTPEGFLDLHQLEAEDSGGVEDDLWLSLQAMGYNECGEMVGCAGFSVSALSQVCNPSLQVCGLRSGGLLLDKAIVRYTMESAEPVRIRNMMDLIKYQHVTSDRACIVLQNKSQRNIKVKLDVSQSVDYKTHRRENVTIFDLPPKSAIVAHHILSQGKNFKLNCWETVL